MPQEMTHRILDDNSVLTTSATGTEFATTDPWASRWAAVAYAHRLASIVGGHIIDETPAPVTT